MARHMSKEEVLDQIWANKKAVDRIWKGNMLISLIILHDKFDFDAADLNEFVDSYHDVLEYYNASNQYDKLLEEWNNYFWDYAGIKVIEYLTAPITGKPEYPGTKERNEEVMQ